MRPWAACLERNIICIFLSLLIVTLCSCKGNSAKPSQQTPEILHADTFQVKVVSIPKHYTVPAMIIAKGAIVLASKTSGYVERVLVHQGDRIRKGQLLLVIDDRGLRARIRSLEASKRAAQDQKRAQSARLSYATSNFRRFKSLLRTRAVTKEQFEKVKAEYLALKSEVESIESRIVQIEAQIQEVRNQLTYLQIKSPVDGWIVKRCIDPGSYVSADKPLLYIDAANKGYWAVAGVDEDLIPKVTVGTPVVLCIPSLNIRLNTKVFQTTPHVDPSTRTFTVKLNVDALHIRGLHSGLFARLIFNMGNRKGILIPRSSLVDRGAITGVFLLNPKRVVHWQVVKVQSGPKGFVEVLGGLEPGDIIASSNIDRLREGVRID